MEKFESIKTNRFERPGWVDRQDNFSEAELEEKALNMLKSIGLTVEDLRNKKIADIGSGPSLIERVARSHGIDSVVSLDKSVGMMSHRPEVKNRVLGDVKALPFADESQDLLISIHATFPGVKNEEMLDEILNENLRVLRGGAKLE